MDNDLQQRRRPELARYFAFMDDARARQRVRSGKVPKIVARGGEEERKEEEPEVEPVVEPVEESVAVEPEVPSVPETVPPKEEGVVTARPPDVLPGPRPMGIAFEHPKVVVPTNRRTFLDWVEETYAPFRMGPIVPDPEACFKRGGSFRAFPYQQVYREML